MQTNNRILIVDDNSSIHDDFTKILTYSESIKDELNDISNSLLGNTTQKKQAPKIEVSYELFHAYQGEDAFKMVCDAEEKNTPYALLIVDVRMPPGWDGVKTIKEIWNKYPDNEVIICTAYSDYSLENIVSELGVSDKLQFLYKPFDVITIKQMVLAKVKKWNLEFENRKYTDNLEQLVAERTKELNHKVKELQKALNEIDQLRTILPMCAWCKKVRNDDHYWQKVDDYLATYTKTDVTHGICPECYEKVVENIQEDNNLLDGDIE